MTMHPLAKFREVNHLSQDDVANLCGITRQIVLFTEQGIYPEIPPSILNGVKSEYGMLETLSWPNLHSAWIKEELDKVDIRPWIGPFDSEGHSAFPEDVNSFVAWRNLVSDSVSGFGKLMKIQPVTIRKYESGATNNLPIQLVERLQHWGFSDEYINKVSALPITGGNNK